MRDDSGKGSRQRLVPELDYRCAPQLRAEDLDGSGHLEEVLGELDLPLIDPGGSARQALRWHLFGQDDRVVVDAGHDQGYSDSRTRSVPSLARHTHQKLGKATRLSFRRLSGHQAAEQTEASGVGRRILEDTQGARRRLLSEELGRTQQARQDGREQADSVHDPDGNIAWLI